MSGWNFILPPTTPEATYRARIFTASKELPFAGPLCSDREDCRDVHVSAEVRLICDELAEQIRSHAGLFPELSQALSSPAPALADNARRFGLDRILDGLAALIAERS